ncbi:MAG TPA: Fur family transcriptional regulator [Anaerolineaceae bacterium]|nr:Fur family transcriptional regulator [Anaerolineaceae bacterium]HOD04706.1 Fur family transcriptional regulator [Anaerolineaceae bacterium]
MPNRADEWMNLLQASGYRQTHARRAIVEILLAAECALEPMEIFEAGRRQAPRLGLVTVYRTLEKLEELGLAQRVHQPQGCNRYLRAPQGHEHLIICTHCGRAVYFQGDELDAFFGRVAEQSGFTVEDHWLQLFGRCARCQ